jgi:hypothetical protein
MPVLNFAVELDNHWYSISNALRLVGCSITDRLPWRYPLLGDKLARAEVDAEAGGGCAFCSRGIDGNSLDPLHTCSKLGEEHCDIGRE